MLNARVQGTSDSWLLAPCRKGYQGRSPWLVFRGQIGKKSRGPVLQKRIRDQFFGAPVTLILRVEPIRKDSWREFAGFAEKRAVGLGSLFDWLIRKSAGSAKEFDHVGPIAPAKILNELFVPIYRCKPILSSQVAGNKEQSGTASWPGAA